jgi:hypothetical protein
MEDDKTHPFAPGFNRDIRARLKKSPNFPGRRVGTSAQEERLVGRKSYFMPARVRL